MNNLPFIRVTETFEQIYRRSNLNKENKQTEIEISRMFKKKIAFSSYFGFSKNYHRQSKQYKNKIKQKKSNKGTITSYNFQPF